MAKTKDKETKVQIKLVKSLIGCSDTQCKVAQALGLKKKDQIVEHAKSATIMGMINKISHLLEVCEV